MFKQMPLVKFYRIAILFGFAMCI